MKAWKLDNLKDDEYPRPPPARVAMARACDAAKTEKMIASKSTETIDGKGQKMMDTEVDFSDYDDGVEEFNDDDIKVDNDELDEDEEDIGVGDVIKVDNDKFEYDDDTDRRVVGTQVLNENKMKVIIAHAECKDVVSKETGGVDVVDSVVDDEVVVDKMVDDNRDENKKYDKVGSSDNMAEEKIKIEAMDNESDIHGAKTLST